MSDVREYEYDTQREAFVAAEAILREGRDAWIQPQHRTAPVEHVVWIVQVRP